MTTQIQINGQMYDAGSLTLPDSGRAFRSAWTTPINGVVQLDAAKVKELMAVKVQEERKRRLALGFSYDFEDARGVHQIGTTPADMVGWRDVIDLANALIDLGDTTTTINIVTDTGPTQVTAPEWQAVMLRAAEVRQVLWASSFTLQAMDPIPEDYDADGYWT
jgi:hypothetical protein